jgi:putative spermidine/putrescine transport system substrate-binding protein
MLHIHLSWCRLLIGLMALTLYLPAWSADTLRVLTWPGYADADLVKVFEQRTGVKVEVTTIDSDEALWQRISSSKGNDFDVFAVNTAELQRYIEQAWVVPIETATIPNTAKQLPRFRNLKSIPGIVRNGKAFAIPYTFAEMGLIYDRKQMKEAPTSIRTLWDPRYRGKVLLYNGGSHNFSLAAQSLKDATPFLLDNTEWPAAVDKLIELRRNALAFYTQPQESVDLFLGRQAALMLANYGSQQLQLLKAAGADVGYAIPKEGALAWLDCWVITRGAKNPALAAAWINYLLESEPSDALVNRQGLANTISASPYLRAEDNLKWLEPVENVDRRNLLWERILAGDRARKVLAP